MAVPVILPTFGKSRKTTKSDPSTGDQLGKREFPARPCRKEPLTTTLSRKPNGRARHFANFRKIEENDKVRSVYGGSVGETRISV